MARANGTDHTLADTVSDIDDDGNHPIKPGHVAEVFSARKSAKKLLRKRTRLAAKKLTHINSEDYEPWSTDQRIDFVLVYKPVKNSAFFADDVQPNPRPNDVDDQLVAKMDSHKHKEEARLRVEYIETLRLNGLNVEVENFTSKGYEYRAIKIFGKDDAMDEMAEKFLLMKPVSPPSGSVLKNDNDAHVDKLIAIYNETLYRLPKSKEEPKEEPEDYFDSNTYVPNTLRNIMNTVVGKFRSKADNAKKRETRSMYKKNKIRDYTESEAFKQLQFMTDKYNTHWTVKIGNWIFEKLHSGDDRLNLMHDTFITRAIRAPFNLMKKEKFLGYGGREFYNSSERSRMVHRILENPDRRLHSEQPTLKLQDMYRRGCFEAAFPLHAGDYKIGGSKTKWSDLDLDKIDNPRKLLRYFWSSSHMKYKYQPINIVRNYFGAITAMYFAYSGFYNMMLFGPAIVGTGVFIYGLIQMFFNEMVTEICESGRKYTMCSECYMSARCDRTYLSDYCFTTRLTSAANNGAVIIFSVLMMVWLALFVTFWKRRQNTIAHIWGTTHSKASSAELRVKYTLTKTDVFRFNKITGRRERHVTCWDRLPQYCIAFSVIAMFLTATLLMTLTITIYKFSLSITFSKAEQSDFSRKYANEIATCITGSISACLIICLSFVYHKVANKLTDMENHRTQRDHDNHLTFKIYIFEFVNYYGTIFYIAFFKGNVTSPKETGFLFQVPSLQIEGCAPGGCMSEVATQMVMIMSIKQLVPITKDIIRTLNLNRIQEQINVAILKPFTCIPAIHRSRERSKKYLAGILEFRKQMIKDFELREPTEMYQEYVNIVIQLGFLTMFVTALPIAPLICLLINFWLLRNDATRYVKRVRRPVGFRAEGIGTWMNILEFLVRIAILVNGALIAFTFDYLPNLLYQTTVSTDNSLSGYVNFMLAEHTFNNTATNQTMTCRYWSYIHPARVDSSSFWLELMVIRMLFVFLFQNCVWALVTALELVIDSTPKTVKERMVLEEKIAQEWLSSDDEDYSDEDDDENETFRNYNFTKRNGKDTTIDIQQDTMTNDSLREDEIISKDTIPLRT